MSFLDGIAFMFLPPEIQASIRRKREEEARAHREQLLAEPIQKWSPNIKWAPKLHIDAESYKPFAPTMFDVPPVGPFSRDHAIRHGDWGYQNVLLPKGTVLFTYLGPKRGDVVFNDDIFFPKIWKNEPWEVWMSFTPMEVLSQRPGFSYARGRVLVGGLGMGWALRQIASRKSVTSIVVAEKCEDLLDWFGRDLVKKIAEETGKTIDIVGEVYEEASKNFDQYDSFILDIWKSYGSARNDRNWIRLRDRALSNGKKAWAWGATRPKEEP